ncbi:MAG: tyrosine-type recombinase/integrase [Planctomycetota bacterium]
MASLNKTKGKNGTIYHIQLSPGEDPQRPKISLGRCTLKDARDARDRINDLLKSNRTSGTLSLATQDWLGKIPDSLRARLERLQLIEPCRGSRWTVQAFIADYIKRRTDVKEPTRRKWRDVEGKLNAFFRGDNIGDVTASQAKNFRIYLQTTAGLSENTLRRHIGIARQFFNAAVDAEIIRKNPFLGQAVSIRANESRFFYVAPEMARKVLEDCPDAQWRLIFGLARFGGLRCPSEVLRLKWEDIDFDRKRFIVHASKTEHHADKGIRTVPMFPELQPLFQDAFDEAKEGDIYCITRYREGSNLGPQMRRIIKRAGFMPWPKTFQNCRSTRETELFKMTGGNVKAVCSWIGNSPQVAMTHYAQLTEADIKEAAEMTVLGEAEKTVHNPVHPSDNSPCTDLNESESNSDATPCSCGANHENARVCDNTQNPQKWALQDLNL